MIQLMEEDVSEDHSASWPNNITSTELFVSLSYSLNMTLIQECQPADRRLTMTPLPIRNKNAKNLPECEGVGPRQRDAVARNMLNTSTVTFRLPVTRTESLQSVMPRLEELDDERSFSSDDDDEEESSIHSANELATLCPATIKLEGLHEVPSPLHDSVPSLADTTVSSNSCSSSHIRSPKSACRHAITSPATISSTMETGDHLSVARLLGCFGQLTVSPFVPK